MPKFLVATRNPSTRKILILADEEGDPAEFNTEDDALATAGENACCRAWGSDVVLVDI
jgi:hypothetical protein